MIGISTPRRSVRRLWPRVARLDAWSAAGWYLLLTLVLTWPVCAHLATALPNDLGDPLFGCWLLKWNVDHVLAVLGGDLGAIGRYWNANIFYPSPLALLYAEHLFALGIQAVPLWLVTHNLLLCYNLIFLSTFVLSGLGAFLLVRELTGSARAGFVAGLFYGFSPYRFAQFGHIQVLSSQWMPFVLYGLHRYFERCQSGGRRGAQGREDPALRPPPSTYFPLAGASLALIAQNLSCGYYLVYFAPFVAAYILWEVGRRGLWRHWRMWAALAAGGAVVVAACLPFLLKYRELRALGFAPRGVEVLREFSADTVAYLCGIDALWLWPGGFATFPKPEGQLFPGVVPVLLAAVGLACLVAAFRRRTDGFAPLRGWRLVVAAPATLIGIAALEFARFELFAGRLIWRVREAWPWLADIRHVFLVIAVCVLVLITLSPRARAVSRLARSSGRVFFTAAFLLAVWLSFGPLVTTRAHGIAVDTLYGWLHRHVPGFDGLRVPARFGMLAMLFLAVLGGYGAAALERARLRWPRRSRDAAKAGWVVAVLAVVFLLEASSMPVPVRRIEWPRKDGVPGTVSAEDLDHLYAFLRKMPRGTVVAEFPVGTVETETRAVYLSTRHGHPIINGYSGGSPAAFDRRESLLKDPVGTGDAAWQAIVDSGATCLVVHQWAFPGSGPALSDWLHGHGAIPLATIKSDRLFLVRR